MERTPAATLPGYFARSAMLRELCLRYRFASIIDAGCSVLGRRIEAVRIGDTCSAVFFAGAFHGQEWLTASLLLEFARRLCLALSSGEMIAGIDCCRAILGRGIVIMPCVNPDGVEIALNGASSAGDLAEEVERISGGDTSSWNANARGVDINHNYDAGWHILRQLEISQGIESPSPGRFGGAFPASEPETQATINLCGQYNFRSVYAFHSQGEEIYWHYGEHTPRKSALMARVLAASSGYQPIMPTGTAAHGGFKDWFIEHYHRPGFTIEIGNGKNPLPLSSLESIYQQLEEMMMLALVM